jgi:hypothetical protein
VRAVGDLLFERPDPTPITPGPQGSKRRDGRVSRRELEHMLDLSAKNVVVAVRLYAPSVAASLSPSSAPPSPTTLSATSPTPADSSSPIPPSIVVTTVEKEVDGEKVGEKDGEKDGEKEGQTALLPPSVISADSRPLLSGHEGNAGIDRITIDTDSIKQKSSADKEDSPNRKGDEAPSPNGPVLRTPVLPVQRIILSTEDLVLSFGRAGRRRRRVLGRY